MKASEAAEASEPRPWLNREQIDKLADDIAVLAARIDAATHQLLTHIRRFDEAKGWARQGAKSCAHWLSWRIGVALPAAREKVRAARARLAAAHRRCPEARRVINTRSSRAVAASSSSGTALKYQ